jgi:hypothetical protein
MRSEATFIRKRLLVKNHPRNARKAIIKTYATGDLI